MNKLKLLELKSNLNIKDHYYVGVFLLTRSEIYTGHVSNKGINIYNYVTRVLENILKELNTIFAMEATSDDRHVIVSGYSEKITIIDTKTRTIKRTILSIGNSNYGLQLTSDNHFLFAVDSRGMLTKYSIDSGIKQFEIKSLFPSQRYCLKLSKNEKVIYGSLYSKK
jgi:tricorn protease-like protein